MNTRTKYAVAAMACVASMVCTRIIPIGAQAYDTRSVSLIGAHEGDPLLQGTYVRPQGLPSLLCGAFNDGLTILPPVYEGVTTIRQSPGFVIIRNQFAPSRTFTFGSHRDERETSRAWWDGHSLVVESLAVRQLRFVVSRRSETADAVRVTERYTRRDEDSLSYTFSVQDVRVEEPTLVIDFPLTSTLSRRPMAHNVTPRCSGNSLPR